MPWGAAKRAQTIATGSGRRAPEPEPVDDGLIDVDVLLAQYTVEELAASADEYFSRLDNWDVLLAKPFYSVHESPELLTSFGALLNGLELSHGLTVLDFGVGSGWTSWMLSQLGCRVIASDVSHAALRIANRALRAASRSSATSRPR